MTARPGKTEPQGAVIRYVWDSESIRPSEGIGRLDTDAEKAHAGLGENGVVETDCCHRKKGRDRIWQDMYKYDPKMGNTHQTGTFD